MAEKSWPLRDNGSSAAAATSRSGTTAAAALQAELEEYRAKYALLETKLKELEGGRAATSMKAAPKAPLSPTPARVPTPLLCRSPLGGSRAVAGYRLTGHLDSPLSVFFDLPWPHLRGTSLANF